MAMEGRDRDLVLAPGEFAFVLDTTKGLINTVVGPNKISMSNTDQPVVWDMKVRRFVRVDLDRAIQVNTIAPEGFYVALFNPADTPPRVGASSVAVDLKVGHRVNLHGPTQFPLWPGQMTEVIRGHHLRSNQYLLAQVYNDAEASANWGKAVLKPQEGTEGSAAPTVVPRSFTPGQLLIIRGTEVAFFMPPTGIKVVLGEDGKFIREAVTLERLEYCILLDENGNKRFVQGPSVVFPEPTETFVVKDGSRKFRAIELNPTSGIYVKVIADYTDETGHHKAGDELFITGSEQAIYFQREEHSVIRYGDQTKHYAVAIPSGEGRYVLDRTNGQISLVRGPQMLLCDPRTQVIVRRVLSQATAALWYPGNSKVLSVNAELEGSSDSSLGGYVVAAVANSGQVRGLSALNYHDDEAARKSRQIVGDTFQRGDKFTPPRMITLDTKYEGAVSVNVWAGYAVLVINKTGGRHVVEGPATMLLEYDETLAPLTLSTGTPKTEGNLLKTAYLKIRDNRVSDEFQVRLADGFPAKIRVTYRVEFSAESSTKWFEVENYIGLLTNRMRSIYRLELKKVSSDQFYRNAIDIIRGIAQVSGEDSEGVSFLENGMRVYDVEVVDTKIESDEVLQLLASSDYVNVKQSVALATRTRDMEIEASLRALQEETAMNDAVHANTMAQHRTAKLTIEDELAKREAATMRLKLEEDARVESARAANSLAVVRSTLLAVEAKRDTEFAALARTQAMELERQAAITAEITARAAAISPQLVEAITNFADAALTEKITTALAPMAAMNGMSAVDVLQKLFAGSSLAPVLGALAERSRTSVSK